MGIFHDTAAKIKGWHINTSILNPNPHPKTWP